MTHYASDIKALRLKEVTRKLDVGRSTLYRWMDPKSPQYDPTFPKPFRIGKVALAWLSNELDAWLIQKCHNRL